ncbi:SDR family NAD(P)-dependent oxidoreductase [Streptomyces sp. LHD-70]|uniref:SDR family NAD(P)-dependent oxidoreductase n=1 Tax=Streptomyces sp. LHD-70 TaxID=3072140 RepID=UPI00280F021B|nr:SDR family NAD(P)-dependent oxidoreductase [Streptomyces sp. LHD-70]MDQ8707144.1 SDR family NAD(P)-dependent oxidoreductase [Streptomyces sp. LHD-70]
MTDSALTGSPFAGRACLVTGAGGGIGSAIARRLAHEGATVVVADIDETAAKAVVEGIAADGGTAEAAHFDLGDGEACRQAVDDAVARYGRLDVLVNNAGINRRGNLLDLSAQDWEASFAVNVHPLFHLCRAALTHMAAQGGGAIVNTASQWGLQPAADYIAYNVTKAAVVAFTRSLARDHAHQGVRVNAVCPGEIRTPMLEAGLASSGRTVAELDSLVPFGRIGTPEEVAALVAFLASDEAPYMCGSIVEITGGQAVA